MWDMTVTYNGQSYIATYNSQTGYYEVELTAPSVGGVNVAEIEFTDIFDEQYTSEKAIQTFIKDPLKLDLNKVFMWIFNYYDFSIKDIVEIADYDINVDEETNAKTIVNVLKKTNAQSRDLVAIKKNNECIYWGIIDEIQNENGKQLYQYSINYITNLFNRTIKLQNENLIKTTGVEDFIENIIENEFVDNEDTFINLTWLEVVVLTHTSKQISVTNVENGIFNLHTWMTNCTQNYDITYSFSIVNQKLRLTIKCMTYSKELIDISAQAVSDYTEVFETNVVSKVTVLYDKVSGADNPGSYNLFLLTDRTTTTNMSDVNRADGRIVTVYTENYEDANQTALNEMKSNSYNHNITFKLLDKLIKVGTPVAIKTKESIILNSYISAIKISPKKFYEYICGNIRIKFIDKLLKEREK